MLSAYTNYVVSGKVITFSKERKKHGRLKIETHSAKMSVVLEDLRTRGFSEQNYLFSTMT